MTEIHKASSADGRKVWRTIFISDVHLGTRGCKSNLLLDFLKHNDSETLYLVGDIIDWWRMRKGIYWPQEHNDVVQKILHKVQEGTRCIYIPGNHDEVLRDCLGDQFGGVEVAADAVHTTAAGKRLLVMHGDLFDGLMQYVRWLAPLGEGVCSLAHRANQCFAQMRRRAGLPYWPLSRFLKCRVSSGCDFVGEFEANLIDEARRRGFDGVVCGHIHSAGLREVGGVLYCNDGDWVGSCTALVEDFDGKIYLLQWQENADNVVETGAAA